MHKIDGCVISTAVDTETIIKQIHQNNQLGLTNLADSPYFREGKPIALVGGGPSLKKYLDELKAFKGPIVACGSVHDFLVANDVAIGHCVLCDPDPLIIKYMRKPQPSITYLIASQCHPDIFKYLENYNSYIWHAGGTNLENTEAFGEGVNLVGGGCTVGTRAIAIAMCMGYRNISLFGFDSSLNDDFKHHAYEFETEGETIGNINEIRLGGPTDKVFYCAGYMVGQIFDFKKLLELYGSQVRFNMRCDGALRRLMDLGIEMRRNEKLKHSTIGI